MGLCHHRGGVPPSPNLGGHWRLRACGRQEYLPTPEALQHLLDVLDTQGVPVFFKRNLRSLPLGRAGLVASFPQRKDG